VDAEKVLTRDEMLDDITLYWLTNTGTSSARLYWENNNTLAAPNAPKSVPKGLRLWALPE
jgi:type IV secretory pathway VirB3-like protein